MRAGRAFRRSQARLTALSWPRPTCAYARKATYSGPGSRGLRRTFDFLSVRRDEALIRAAKDEAEALLAEDPTLRSHPDLARALRQASDGQLEWMQRS